MNHTTMRQRAVWISAASRLIALDADGACTNAKQVQNALMAEYGSAPAVVVLADQAAALLNSLMAEYGISLGSAKTAVARAIMRARGAMWDK